MQATVYITPRPCELIQLAWGECTWFIAATPGTIGFHHRAMIYIPTMGNWNTRNGFVNDQDVV